MPSLSFHDRQHVQKLLQQQNIIGNIFNDFSRKVSLILRQWTETGNANVWVRNSSVEKAIDRLLIDLHADLIKNIDEFGQDAISRSNLKNDELITEFIKSLPITDVIKQGIMGRNFEALKSLQRINTGVGMSERVWSVTEGVKSQMEFYLGSGLSVGRPATGISQDVRQLLKEPDKRFRRIRNEEGKLVMSKPMADYHPGQGVYRSSYMNALRLSSTNTNMNYRRADHERWKNMDFVLGINVSRSKSNRGPCPICDALAGNYPKGFVYIGWHPFCICPATPIMMDAEEFADYLLEGKIPEHKIIKEMPASTQKYLQDHADSLISAQNKPFWIRENFVDSDIRKGTVLQQVRRKDLWEWSKENLKGEVLRNRDFDKDIVITNKGLKEFLNQPHKHFAEKNELVKNIHSVLQYSEYIGVSDYHKDDKFIKYSHVFEIELGGEKTWLIAREDVTGKVTLYSVSDSDKVLKGVKRK